MIRAAKLTKALMLHASLGHRLELNTNEAFGRNAKTIEVNSDMLCVQIPGGHTGDSETTCEMVIYVEGNAIMVKHVHRESLPIVVAGFTFLRINKLARC